MNKALLIVLILSTALSCGEKKKKGSDFTAQPAPNEFVAEIENAHKKNEFLQKNGIVYNLQLTSRGDERLSTRIWMKTDFSRIRMENNDGTTLIYDGENVYQTPADAEYKSARFDIFTWPYFFSLPYKLSDPGTNWDIQGTQRLNDNEYETGKLTFEEGTGDASDDWYLVYANPFDHKIFCAAYIVTFNKSEEKANKDPHAITYEEYVNFNDIPIATEWTFWQWREDEGLTQQLMKGSISNLNFARVHESLFNVPDDSKLVEKP